MTDLLVITNSDGARETYPWPEGKSILGNADFVGPCGEDFLAKHPETSEWRMDVESIFEVDL